MSWTFQGEHFYQDQQEIDGNHEVQVVEELNHHQLNQLNQLNHHVQFEEHVPLHHQGGVIVEGEEEHQQLQHEDEENTYNTLATHTSLHHQHHLSNSNNNNSSNGNNSNNNLDSNSSSSESPNLSLLTSNERKVYKSKDNKTLLSEHQSKTLWLAFYKNPMPSTAVRKKLATQLEMTPKAVQIWFQNRRQWFKAKGSDMNCSHGPRTSVKAQRLMVEGSQESKQLSWIENPKRLDFIVRTSYEKSKQEKKGDKSCNWVQFDNFSPPQQLQQQQQQTLQPQTPQQQQEPYMRIPQNYLAEPIQHMNQNLIQQQQMQQQQAYYQAMQQYLHPAQHYQHIQHIHQQLAHLKGKDLERRRNELLQYHPDLDKLDADNKRWRPWA